MLLIVIWWTNRPIVGMTPLKMLIIIALDIVDHLLNLICRHCRYRTALETTNSIEEGGGLNWKMVGCLVGAWLLLFVIVFRGVQSVGKVDRHFLFHFSCSLFIFAFHFRFSFSLMIHFRGRSDNRNLFL